MFSLYRPVHQRPGQGPRQGPIPQDKRQDHVRNKAAVRPTVLRPEDIQAMDDDDDDGGWAGAHGEVDYTAKLNFEDFDDEDKDKHMHKDEDNREQRPRPDRQSEIEKVKDPIVLKRPMVSQECDLTTFCLVGFKFVCLLICNVFVFVICFCQFA